MAANQQGQGESWANLLIAGNGNSGVTMHAHTVKPGHLAWLSERTERRLGRVKHAEAVLTGRDGTLKSRAALSALCGREGTPGA
jgi:hypothetical protein